MENKNPVVSVVIPVYNRAAQVRRAVESVLRQTYQNFEIVVVDDGSTDGTVAAVTAFTDARVRLIRHDSNRGGSAARNTGIGASTGEYVAFLDSDDEWLPNKLERQVEVFARSTETPGLVYTGFEYIYPDGQVRCVVARRRRDLVTLLLRANCVGGCSVGMVPRYVLDDIGGFDETLPARQDVDLWVRIAQTYSAEVVPDVLVRIVRGIGAERITVDVRGRLEGRELFYAKHASNLRRYGLLHLYLRDSGWKYYHELGDARRARECYWKSLVANPVAPLTYALLLLSLFPVSAFERMLARKREVVARLRLRAGDTAASRRASSRPDCRA